MMHKPRHTFCQLALCALALAACTPEDEPATQIIVSLNSDLMVDAQLTRVRIEIKSGSESSTPRTFNLTTGAETGGRVRLPFSFGITKGGAERVTVIATGFGPMDGGGGEGAIVERKENVRFREGEALLLKLFLSETCQFNLCGTNETCQLAGTAAGECGPIRDAADLDPIEPGDEDDAWDENGGSGGSSGNGGSGGDEAGSGGGEAGSGGSGGTGGDGGSGGTGGDSGSGGTGGDSGSGGTGGSGTCDPPCEGGEQCIDGECSCEEGYDTYFEDSDGDGYGNPSAELQSCGRPDDYVDNALDCCDLDVQVYHESQEASFIPSLCGSGNDDASDWDYDCDGNIEGFTPVASGECCVTGYTDGWVDVVPFCGELGTFALCNTTDCVFETMELFQECL